MIDLEPLALALAEAGVADPWKEVRLLWADVCGVDYTAVLGCRRAVGTEEQEAVLYSYVVRRRRREPLTKILGRANFWNFTVATSTATLDPRPESEVLIEAVCAHYPDHAAPLRFCDLGTGTGCLLLACLSEYTAATGIGVDISAEALKVARANAFSLDLASRSAWRQGMWCAPLDGLFNVVISNPPYIRTDAQLPPEVLFEPSEALFAGQDGLDAYRYLCSEVSDYIAPGGRVFFEIGCGQADDVMAIAAEKGLCLSASYPDLAGITRVLVLESRGKHT